MKKSEFQQFGRFKMVKRKISSSEPLTITESYVEKVKAGNSCSISGCEIERLKAMGPCTIENSMIHDCLSFSECTMKEKVRALTITAMGLASFDHTTCKVFRNASSKDGTSLGSRKISGSIAAVTYENYTSSVLDYEFNYINILNKYFLECAKAIECGHFISFAPFYIPAIQAEVMYIRPYFNTFVTELKADKLIIANKLKDRSIFDDIISMADYRDLVNKQFETSHMHVDRIEAKTLILENCDAKIVIADHAIIKDDCVIDELYAKSYEISKNAQVNKLAGGSYAAED